MEKIAQGGERLPPTWPVAGMTGYDALREVNTLLVDPGAEDAMTRLYLELTGDERDFGQQAQDGKRMVVSTIMQAEVRRLARLVPEAGSPDDTPSPSSRSPSRCTAPTCRSARSTLPRPPGGPSSVSRT